MLSDHLLENLQGCDEYEISGQSEAENLDTLMWFKLLFVPTLGIIILTLFLMEEYCSSFRSQSDEAEGDEAVLKQNQLKDETATRSYLSGPIRVNLIDQKGKQSCYRINPDIILEDLLYFYCERTGKSSDSIIMRYEGRKLILDQTPDESGLQDLSIIDVEPDHSKLLEDLQLATAAETEKLENMLTEERKARETSENRLKRIQEDFDSFLQESKEKAGEVESMKSGRLQRLKTKTKYERDLKTHRDAIARSLEATNAARVELNADVDKKERKRLEKELADIRSDVEAAKLSLEEKKSQNGKALKKLHEKENKLKEYTHRKDTLEKEVARWRNKANKNQMLEDKAESLEKCRAEVQKWKRKVEQQEREYQDCVNAAEQLKVKLRGCEVVHKELERQRQWYQTLEREYREVERLRDEHSTATGKDRAKKGFGASDRAGLGKDGADLREMQYWRKRLKSLDEEFKQLSMLKQQTLAEVPGAVDVDAPDSSYTLYKPTSLSTTNGFVENRQRNYSSPDQSSLGSSQGNSPAVMGLTGAYGTDFSLDNGDSVFSGSSRAVSDYSRTTHSTRDGLPSLAADYDLVQGTRGIPSSATSNESNSDGGIFSSMLTNMPGTSTGPNSQQQSAAPGTAGSKGLNLNLGEEKPLEGIPAPNGAVKLPNLSSAFGPNIFSGFVSRPLIIDDNLS